MENWIIRCYSRMEWYETVEHRLECLHSDETIFDWQALKFSSTRSDEDGALRSALELKKSFGKVEVTTLLSTDKSSTITLQHGAFLPNLTLKLERLLTPSATVASAAVPASTAAVDKGVPAAKPASADAAAGSKKESAPPVLKETAPAPLVLTAGIPIVYT